jgi:hypothetical protein
MRKFLEIKKFFQKIFKKFQPLTPRTKNFPAAAAADREKKIEISQPPPPPPRKTSAYTSKWK